MSCINQFFYFFRFQITRKALYIFPRFLDIITTYAYKNRNSIQSDYLRPHDHNTRFRSDLLPHYERLATSSQSLHYVLPNIWNTIPTDIKNSESVFIFKRNNSFVNKETQNMTVGPGDGKFN